MSPTKTEVVRKKTRRSDQEKVRTVPSWATIRMKVEEILE
jgi:hypothetical protein